MSEQWGPWIEHDGKGCPLPAEVFVEVKLANEQEFVGALPAAAKKPDVFNPWFWENLPPEAWEYRVIRYRVRKPRALQDLIKLVEELPEGADA